MRTRLWLRLAFAGLATLGPWWVGAAGAIGISAPFVTAMVGQVVTIPVVVTDASGLAYLQFDMDYAPQIVAADPAGAAAGPMLPDDWFFSSPGAVDVAAGRILGVSSFGSAVDGSGTIAYVGFRALRTGVSPLRLSNAFLNLEDQGVQITDGQITVIVPPPVPLSPSLPLLIAALVAVSAWWLRRRRPLGRM